MVPGIDDFGGKAYGGVVILVVEIEVRVVSVSAQVRIVSIEK